LFYRTLNGAQVGDLFMSLIQTCQLCGANSFDYLTELQRHAQKLRPTPPSESRGTTARQSSELKYDESCLAGKDRRQPYGVDSPEWPVKWPSGKKRDPKAFSASNEER
jgi:predicted  nucleic acid-binding Zn-ribbon protein